MANPIDQFNSQEFTVNHEFLNSSICQPTLDSPSPNAQNIIVVAQHTSDTQPPVFRTMNSSPISRIPNELLDNILAYILPQQDPLGRYWRQRQVIAASISLTSKRFNQITQPLLYHTIFLANFTSFQLIPPGQNTKLFFRTMESKPALRALCKSLTIRISIRDLDEKDISKSTSLLLWLTNVRNFHVSGGFDSPSIMSMLCSALQNMPFVDNLKLSPDSPPSLAQVYKHFVFPQLRALSLESAVEGSHSGSAIGLIPQAEKGKGLFTTLDIHCFHGSPSALQDFLLWPKRLETFSLSGISWNSVPSNWDWETIWLLLIPHRSSLRHLTIGPLRRNEAQVIDFTQFTQLAYLELSMYDINSTPREAVSRLLAAPKLSSLTFSYTVEDQHPEQWSSFDEKQAEWIRQFATFARKSPSSLRQIKIKFHPPAYDISYDENMRDRIYPWDVMDRIRDAIRPLGIILSYSTPSLSKEEFDRRVKGPEEGISEALEVEVQEQSGA